MSDTMEGLINDIQQRNPIALFAVDLARVRGQLLLPTATATFFLDEPLRKGSMTDAQEKRVRDALDEIAAVFREMVDPA